jgi:hypothetical protein
MVAVALLLNVLVVTRRNFKSNEVRVEEKGWGGLVGNQKGVRIKVYIIFLIRR